jgi:hypothetical protein
MAEPDLRSDETKDRDAEIARAIARATKRERERCAKIAENYYNDRGWHEFYKAAGGTIGAAIRHPEVE